MTIMVFAELNLGSSSLFYKPWDAVTILQDNSPFWIEHMPKRRGRNQKHGWLILKMSRLGTINFCYMASGSEHSALVKFLARNTGTWLDLIFLKTYYINYAKMMFSVYA